MRNCSPNSYRAYRGSLNLQKGWWIERGDSARFQRAEIKSASDAPLSDAELLICGLCEALERRDATHEGVRK